MVKLFKRVFLPGRETPNLATWLGGSCFFVEFQNGLRVLINPFFEESPLAPLLQRYSLVEGIPSIDAVMICHNNHNLSYPILEKIAQKHPLCRFFVPRGNKGPFLVRGIKHVTEMDWWELSWVCPPRSPSKGPIQVQKLETIDNMRDVIARITCLPCRDSNNEEFCDGCELSNARCASWYIEACGKKVFLVGYVIETDKLLLFGQ